MKKLNIITGFILIIGAVGCKKELNRAPLNNLSAQSFYNNTSDFEQAVNAVYAGIRGYDVRFLELSEMRSDNVYVVGTGPRDYSPIKNFESAISANALISGTWNANYNAIFRANIVLDKLNETVVPDAAKRARMEGEVKFLRALMYFDLVRTYGKVPLVQKVLSPTEALEVPRSPVEEVYALIISDLQKAATLLPDSYTGANRGRATLHAANALLAQVYLTRSGPKLHPDGPCLGLNEYTQAIALLNGIINSNKFSLQPTYAAVFSYINEYNSEIIFDIQASDPLTTADAGTGTSLPSQWYEALYGTSVNIGFAGGVALDGTKEPSRDLINSFEPADVRDNFSILPTYVYQGSTRNQPQFVKFLDITRKPLALNNWSINFPVMRYADVLLMKAEAILRAGSGGTPAEVDALVRLVRNRAGLSGSVLTNVTLDQLLLESRHEFMNEGRRWHELVRTGKVITVMNAFNNTEDETREKKVFPMTNDYIIYPIPQAEIAVNPKLPQNPGY